MFGLGFPEIIFIIVVAAVILGPEHMPRAANLLGKWSAKLRSAATTFGEAIANDEDLREIKTTVDEVKTEIDTVKNELTGAKRELLEISGSAESAFEEARRELKNLGQLPEESEITPENVLAEGGRTTEDKVKPSSLAMDSAVSEAAEQSEPRIQQIALARPVLLPGKISRQVSRFRIPLSAVSVSACATAQRHVVLEQVRAETPFLRIRKLNQAVKSDTGALKCIWIEPAEKRQTGGDDV